LTDVSSELVRDKLLALIGAHATEADLTRVLTELLRTGGGVTLEFDDVRLKVVMREGRYHFKREEIRRSSLPPRASNLPPRSR
jgi:hypothetical protein